MAPSTPKPLTLTRISPIYRIFFLYIEPFFALSGTYLALYNPHRLLTGTVPVPAIRAIAPLTITPLIQLLVTNIGALYALFAINEALVLRFTREKNVWLAVVLAMFVCDTGHLWAVYQIAPERMFDLAGWNGDEWINNGSLWFGATLRLAFLLGFGRN